MKEQIRPVQSELTINSNPPTLDVRGPRQGRGKDIYMPEPGNGEIGQQPDLKKASGEQKINKPITSDKFLTPEEIEEARKEWEEFNKDRVLDIVEKKTQQEMIDMGIGPVGRGAATWKTKDEDRPINITGYLGKGPDGRDYVSIEGSTTGVPLDEIEYPQETVGNVPKPAGEVGGEGGEPPKEPPTETAAPQEPENENTEEQDSTGRKIDLEGYKEDKLKNIIKEHNNEEGKFEKEDLARYLDELRRGVRELRDAGSIDADEANKLISEFNTRIVRAFMASGDRERYGFYLMNKDVIELGKDPIVWLDSQFDILYKLTQEGQELNSPLVNRMQNVVGDAITYVQYNKPELLDRFQSLFTVRFNLIQMRTAMGYKDIESVKSSAFKLGVHGLFLGLGLENGRVESMFNRFQEIMQSERLKLPEFHLTPEIASKLQEKLIKEQLEMATEGGLFGAPQKEGETIEHLRDRIKLDVVRAVRTAYDIFVSSQRMGVIVARGKHLPGAEAYFSDPIGPLNLYNYEEMLTAKFGFFSLEQQGFLRALKLEIADYYIKDGQIFGITTEDQKEEYGAKLFRDLFKVPDFFTSGWRIQGMLQSLEERLGKEKAQDFALFMRLKDPRANDNEKQLVWEKIIKYKPEEIIGMFREADSKSLEGINGVYSAITNNIDPSLKPTSDEVSNGITVYDKFKDEYAPVIRFLREQGFRQNPPTQIDFANLNSDQKAVIDRLKGDGAGERVEKIFAKMQEYINRDKMVNSILTDHKFAGMLERTWIIDDALLSKMEDTVGGEYIPLSKKFSTEQGGDSLVRSWNDHENAAKAMQALIAFIKNGENSEENIKAAQTFAESINQYNGEGEKARAYAFTRGTYLKLALQNIFLDGMGIRKAPLRIRTTEIERIFGPQAKTISRDEAREILDHERTWFTANVKRDELKNQESVEKAAKLFHYMEMNLEATLGGAIKRRAITFIAFIFLAFGVEINEFRKKLTDVKA